MTEAGLLAAVRQLAHYSGWMTYHTQWSRGSEPGWPDLVLLHPGRRRCLFVELKTETGKLTAAQQAWLDALTACGLDARVWRPADLPDIAAVLRAARPVDHVRARDALAATADGVQSRAIADGDAGQQPRKGSHLMQQQATKGFDHG